MALQERFLFKFREESWWGSQSSAKIFDRISRISVENDGVKDLVSFWNSVQGRKDTKSARALQTGRNKLSKF